MDIGKQFIEIITGKWSWLFIISIIGSLGFAAMALPQFIKVLKSRNTTSMTLSYTIILPICNTLILGYNIGLFIITYLSGTFAWAILFCMVINGLISCYGTMVIKIKNYKAAKKLKISEEQYYKQYIKPKLEAKKHK